MRWLFPYVPDGEGRKVRNVLPLMARWKILDNLRRSLVAPSLLLWLVASCALFPGLGVAVGPFCFSGHRVPCPPARNHGSVDAPARNSLDQPFLECLGRLSHQHRADSVVICFPGAPGVANVRRDHSRALPATDLTQKLLEWVSAAEAEQSAKHFRIVRSLHVGCSGAFVSCTRAHVRFQAVRLCR